MRGLPPVLKKPTSILRIILSGFHRRDTERVYRAVAVQAWIAAWQSNSDYAARGEPRGRKFGAGFWLRNASFPPRAEEKKKAPLGYQEPISCDAKRSVMVEPTPVTPFKMSQAQFLFQLLVVPLDDPAVFGHLYQVLQLCFRRQCRQPVFDRFCFSLRPFHQ